MIDEILSLSPTISDPRGVAAGNSEYAERTKELRPLETLPQAPQSATRPREDQADEPGGQPADSASSAR